MAKPWERTAAILCALLLGSPSSALASLPCHVVVHTSPGSLVLSRVGRVKADGKLHITYSIDSSSPTEGIDPTMQRLINEAAAQWTAFSNTTSVVLDKVGGRGDLHFKRVRNSAASCAEFDPDDGEILVTDGLNHLGATRSDLHTRVRWSMKHEIGHFLGLGHPSPRGSVVSVMNQVEKYAGDTTCAQIYQRFSGPNTTDVRQGDADKARDCGALVRVGRTYPGGGRRYPEPYDDVIRGRCTNWYEVTEGWVCSASGCQLTYTTVTLVATTCG